MTRSRFASAKAHCLTGLSLSVLLALAPAARAAITQYTDKAAFEAALAAGAYTEADMYGSYPNYSGGSGFSYTLVPAGGESQGIGNDISTQNSDESSLQFLFGPGIKAFGGYFYSIDFDGNLSSDPLSITLDGGDFVVSPSPVSSSATSFYGFISASDFNNATISVATTNYISAGTVIVGTPAPAPAPLPLLGAAAAFRVSRRLRARITAERPGA